MASGKGSSLLMTLRRDSGVASDMKGKAADMNEESWRHPVACLGGHSGFLALVLNLSSLMNDITGVLEYDVHISTMHMGLTPHKRCSSVCDISSDLNMHCVYPRVPNCNKVYHTWRACVYYIYHDVSLRCISLSSEIRRKLLTVMDLNRVCK